MAKKTTVKATETEAPTETTAKAEAPKVMTVADLKEVITGNLTLESVERDGESPVETKSLVMSKGKDEGGTIRYVASCNGVSGKVAGSVAAAVNDLLVSGLKVLPAAWVVPKNEKGIGFPVVGDNKPKEPEKLDDLPPEMQEAMKAQFADLSADFAEYKLSETRTRETVRKVAQGLRDIRVAYDKAQWTIFVGLADASSNLAKLLTAKNTLGEFVFLANIPDALYALMPEGKASPKAAQAWVNGLRSTLAHTIVERVKGSTDLADTGLSNAVRMVIEAHIDGSDAMAFDTDRAAIDVLLSLHWDNIYQVERFFDVSGDGAMVPARDADKKHVTGSLFAQRARMNWSKGLQLPSMAINPRPIKRLLAKCAQRQKRLSPMPKRSTLGLLTRWRATCSTSCLAGLTRQARKRWKRRRTIALQSATRCRAGLML
jgi:hypothetical protein